MVPVPPKQWLYEPDEQPKKKHHWTRSFAGFLEVDGEKVGKCPSTIDAPMAEKLLNTQSLAYHNPRAPGPLPDRLYLVHSGIVYRATWTRPGVSFHAFPEDGAHLRKLPGRVRRDIVALAVRLGCRAEVEEWMAQ